MLKLPFTEDDFSQESVKEIWRKTVKSIEGLSLDEIRQKYLELCDEEGDDRPLKLMNYEYILQLNDPDGGIWSDKHQVVFPYRAAYIDGKNIKPIADVSYALNKIKGVSSSMGVLYAGESYNHGRAVWNITFDSIATLQHFLWAGCFRYFPLEHNNDWLLKLDSSDPDYNDTSVIHCNLQYQNLDADRAKWEEDMQGFAEGLEMYAKNEDTISEKLKKQNTL